MIQNRLDCCVERGNKNSGKGLPGSLGKHGQVKEYVRNATMTSQGRPLQLNTGFLLWPKHSFIHYNSSSPSIKMN